MWQQKQNLHDIIKKFWWQYTATKNNNKLNQRCINYTFNSTCKLELRMP